MENYCDHQADVGTNGGGLGLDGGMAAKMLIPDARHLVKLGDLDPVDATPLTDAGLTPYHAVKRSLPLLGPGSTAVVIGAGGLGNLGIQILEALTPAAIVAVDTRASALALATDAGARATVTASGDVDAMVAAVTDAARGRAADVVIDFVGVDATLALGARVVRQLGHLTIVGLGGGTLPGGFFSLAYEASVATTYWGSVTELMEVVDLARAGKIRPRVARYPLSGAMDAYEAMRRGELDARAVIIPDDS
jgi:propanol-preferring alcohol dehydrogenase